MRTIYHWLLALYPLAFRQEYSREMELTLRDRLREEPDAARRARAWFEAITGLLLEAPKEHCALLLQDLRYTMRSLRQSPGFAVAAIVTLALGIGASTAVFSAVDAILLRPLPYPQADRLVMLWETQPDISSEERLVSPANLFDWRARSSTIENMAMFRPHRVALLGDSEPVEVAAYGVSHDFFPILGIAPLLGRVFSKDDDLPGAPPVVVISHQLWMRAFTGDEDILGRSLTANATNVTVVGVMPADFQFLSPDVDMWSPVAITEARDWRAEAGRFVHAVARLRPGVKLASAQAELSVIASQLEAEHVEFNAGWRVAMVSLRDQLAGKLRRGLWLLLAAVGFLLAIACANVANLLLARGATRRREVAVRLALGAGRARLVRQLLTESLTLSLLGAVGGVALAWAGLRGFEVLRPVHLGNTSALSVDGRVLLFSVALALATGILFGLAPGFAGLRADLQQALRERGRGAQFKEGKLRVVFVVAQCAMTVVLLMGAGLLLRSFVKLQSQAPGLEASRLLTMRVSLPGAAYRGSEPRVQFFSQAVERLEALPGVQSASATGFLPFTGEAPSTWVQIAGRPPTAPGKELLTVVRVVMPKYFETMGIPLLSGRSFTSADNRDTAPLSFVVNREFVKRFLEGADPLQQRISVLMRDDNPFAAIVGVVGDVREGALDKSPEPTAYFPHGHLAYPGVTLVVRTTNDPMALAAEARNIIREMDANQPVTEVRSMEQVLASTLARQRFSAMLLGAFSSLALLLAALGVYSVLSYIVVERSHELGIRMAMGARPGDVVRLVLRQGLGWTALGLAAGVALTLALMRFLGSLLFGVAGTDSMTMAGVSGLLLVVGFLATLLPAWRAVRLDPVRSLRQD